ncbi:hypothetical protein M0R45_032493 [Rubus argutus]|uniref:CCHC-type domain-containing protein n=1 Tax=Rubus argutus TaxID=59490 RepID=A0AAW1WHD3_RUBAR
MALLSLLMATLEEDIVDVIIGCKTSHQAWLALHERLSTVSRVSIMQLKTELQTIRKGGEGIEKYLQRVKSARDQLLSVGVVIPEEDIVIVILNGLPDEYSTVRTVVEGRETPITLRDLRAQLLAVERRIEGSLSFPSNLGAMVARGAHSQTEERTGSTKGWSAKFDSKEKGVKQGSSGTECPACGKRGHTIDTCFRIHKCQICGRHGHLTSTCYQNPEYKTQRVQPQSEILNSNGPSPECQICSKKGHTAANCFYRTNVPADHPSLSIPTCQICGLKGHVALNCSNRTNFAYQGSEPPASLTALTASTGSYNGGITQSQGGFYVSNTSSPHSSFPSGFNPSSGASSSSSNLNAPVVNEVWIGDSGATHHMTSDIRNLTIAQPYTSDNKITIGNGTGQGIKNNPLPRKE